MKSIITKPSLLGAITLTTFFISCLTTAAAAQSTTKDSGMSMMGQGMMGQGIEGGMMQPGMMSAMPMMGMPGHMMKVMFAIADINGDGGLSFEEVTTLHKRIFDEVDVNKDGKVTIEEFQSFMRE
jgi:hypothetical protein